MSTWLNENDVLAAVERAFASQGFRVERKCSTSERGVDLHVRHASTGSEWLVEAKGETSANASSKRFGKPFTPSQIGVHVAMAMHQAMSLRAAHPAKRIGIALPDERRHRAQITAVGDALDQLSIAVIWVTPDGAAQLPDTL